MSDEHEIDPAAPIDPNSAAVRSKVWTLLDGECTAEVCETTRSNQVLALGFIA